MSDKFKNVPVEEDTKILFSAEATYGEFDTLYQLWKWDGIQGESLIFANRDIEHLDDADFLKDVATSPMNKGKETDVTFKRSSSGYTFFNMNFEI